MYITNFLLQTCYVQCHQLTRLVISWARSWWPRAPFVSKSKRGRMEKLDGGSCPASSLSRSFSASYLPWESPSSSSPLLRPEDTKKDV